VREIKDKTVRQVAASSGVDQRKIANLTGISQGHLSRIFNNGAYGTCAAKKIGESIDIPWHKVFSMTPAELYKALAEKIEAQDAN